MCLVVVGLASSLGVDAAYAQSSAGVRAGVSVNPDQFYFGGHVQTAPLIDRLHFRPNVEIGVGDKQSPESVQALGMGRELARRQGAKLSAFVAVSVPTFFAHGQTALDGTRINWRRPVVLPVMLVTLVLLASVVPSHAAE